VADECPGPPVSPSPTHPRRARPRLRRPSSSPSGQLYECPMAARDGYTVRSAGRERGLRRRSNAEATAPTGKRPLGRWNDRWVPQGRWASTASGDRVSDRGSDRGGGGDRVGGGGRDRIPGGGRDLREECAATFVRDASVRAGRALSLRAPVGGVTGHAVPRGSGVRGRGAGDGRRRRGAVPPADGDRIRATLLADARPDAAPDPAVRRRSRRRLRELELAWAPPPGKVIVGVAEGVCRRPPAGEGRGGGWQPLACPGGSPRPVAVSVGNGIGMGGALSGPARDPSRGVRRRRG